MKLIRSILPLAITLLSSLASIGQQQPDRIRKNSLLLDFNLICVDSVWYEPASPFLINVRIFNGNSSHLNYPSVQIVSPSGHTIGNPSNQVNFFAHLGNRFLVYQDTIIQSGISDFSNYTFVMNEGFGDTSVSIGWCTTLGMTSAESILNELYPNPGVQTLHLSLKRTCIDCSMKIISSDGRIIPLGKLPENISLLTYDISELASGFYILQLENKSVVEHFRFIKK